MGHILLWFLRFLPLKILMNIDQSCTLLNCVLKLLTKLLADILQKNSAENCS
jgi:hypothetical protein